jgi:hypothetical protein
MNSKSVRELDARILDLARYEVSRGGTCKPAVKEVKRVFRDFKRLLMSMEFTIQELDDSVRARHGAPGYAGISAESLGVRDADESDLARMPQSEVISSEFLS